jgi:SAM-dependent methyltransferase
LGGKFRQWLFARWLLPAASAHHERLVADRKRQLFANLRPGQRAVELGPGTGPNFAYFPADVHWTGIEPNPYLRKKLQPAVAVSSSRAIPSLSADVVICTLVLCSVDDPAAVLQEVLRILRPGGRFLFLEHVAAKRGSRRHRSQCRIRRIWGWAGDGCDVCRETAAALAAAGFSTIEMEEFDLESLGPAAPHIMGVARK